MKFSIDVCSECLAFKDKAMCYNCPCFEYPMKEIEVFEDGSVVKTGKMRDIDYERFMLKHGGQRRDPCSWKVNNIHIGKRRNKKTHS